MVWQKGAGSGAGEGGAINVDVHEAARDGRVMPLAEADLANAVGVADAWDRQLPPLVVLVLR